jgi:hypothetical protein
MRGIARRLDNDARQVEPGWHRTLIGKRTANALHA